MKLLVVSGRSGSGKSVALRVMEDLGYYCVDNLPPELLVAFVALEHEHHGNRLAIAMDVRSASSVPLVPAQLAHLRLMDVDVRLLFLDARAAIASSEKVARLLAKELGHDETWILREMTNFHGIAKGFLLKEFQ